VTKELGGVWPVLRPVGTFSCSERIHSPAAVAKVEFAARLPVGRAYLFAVTAERPGGVVVSDRTRIVAVATL
jgi:hypothetical protein